MYVQKNTLKDPQKASLKNYKKLLLIGSKIFKKKKREEKKEESLSIFAQYRRFIESSCNAKFFAVLVAYFPT